MGWISVVFVHKALDVLGGLAPLTEVKRAELFRSVNVDPQAPVDPKQMVADTQFFDLLERIVDDYPRARAVPVLMGAAMRCDDYGAFGLAFKSAPDLAGSYRRVERYGKVVTSIANFRLVDEQNAAALEVIPGDSPRLGLTMTKELAVAAATSISREVSKRPFGPLRVEFMHGAPSDNEHQEIHFQCPIIYGAKRDALIVDRAALIAPNQLGDGSIAAFFDTHLDRELEDVPTPLGLANDVLGAIREVLSEGVPTLAQTAMRLGMSSRTLQRRLSTDNQAYQDLVVEARQSLAQSLLTNTDYALAEVAFLTGFSDQSTFTRAFKRWSGTTPAGYRQASQ